MAKAKAKEPEVTEPEVPEIQADKYLELECIRDCIFDNIKYVVGQTLHLNLTRAKNVAKNMGASLAKRRRVDSVDLPAYPETNFKVVAEMLTSEVQDTALYSNGIKSDKNNDLGIKKGFE